MKKAAVIGYPIKHSLSPTLHSFWLNANSIQGSYEAIEITPDTFEEQIKELASQGYEGFNVTLPFKEKIMDFLSSISPEAQALGAVNTVVVKDKSLHGYNSDVYGFIKNIEENHPSFNFKGAALILGAGGASRAAIYALQQKGMEIFVSNRTKEKAFSLESDFDGITVIDWQDKENCLSEITLLVNTTSLGMAGNPDLEIDLSEINQKSLVYDIVYNPIETTLLKSAAAHGCKTLDGIEMLIYQGVMGFDMWFGVTPSVTKEIREKLLEQLI